MNTKPSNEIKSHRINLCVTEAEFKLLEKIRYNHKRSISQLVRDAILFYGIYYTEPIKTDL
jgi:hypothetical protein